MKRIITAAKGMIIVGLILATAWSGQSIGNSNKSDKGKQTWQDSFGLDKCTHLTKGKNKYFILEPGYQIVLADQSEQVVITVLDKTETMNGIVTRVIEEKEFKNNKLKEVSRNYFTICKEHNDVFYHGEDVDDYKNGKIVDHGGAWRAGTKGARAGLIMPAKTPVGLRHYQEIAPKVAMDRAEIVGDNEVLEGLSKGKKAGKTKGKYKNCLKVKETSPLEPGSKSIKLYAPNVGMVFDNGLIISEYGYNRTSPEKALKVTINVQKAYSEVEIEIDDMPKPVAETVKRLYPNGRIQEVKKEKRPGTEPFYALEIFIGDDQYDLEVAADGKVLSNKKE